jgi:general secretion pathway protein G
MQRGFTLIEVLITAAIVATLASIALPLSQVSLQRSKETDLRRALKDIRDALDAYKRASDEGRIQRSPDQSGYPPTLSALVDGVPDAKSPSGSNIYFLRRVPRDPFNGNSSVPPERTWGLRSYDSPPNAPLAGKDVFDVYSLNERNGLNGVRYKDW